MLVYSGSVPVGVSTSVPIPSIVPVCRFSMNIYIFLKRKHFAIYLQFCVCVYDADIENLLDLFVSYFFDWARKESCGTLKNPLSSPSQSIFSFLIRHLESPLEVVLVLFVVILSIKGTQTLHTQLGSIGNISLLF